MEDYLVIYNRAYPVQTSFTNLQAYFAVPGLVVTPYPEIKIQ